MCSESGREQKVLRGLSPPQDSVSRRRQSQCNNPQNEGIQRVLSLPWMTVGGNLSQATDLRGLHGGSGISFAQCCLKASCILSTDLGSKDRKPVKMGPGHVHSQPAKSRDEQWGVSNEGDPETCLGAGLWWCGRQRLWGPQSQV